MMTWQVRYFAVFCAAMVGVNFVLVCTFYFAGLVLWDRHLRFKSLCKCPGPQRAAATPEERAELAGVSLTHRGLHAFASLVGRVVIRHRRVVLVVFGLITAVMIGFGVTIPDPAIQLANPYWEPDSPLGRR